MQKNPKLTEKELIQQFSRMIRAKATRSQGVVVGVGDDAAVLRPRPGEDLLVTTDILVEDRHFRREWFTGFALGWRLAAVNLSDIAAMGGRPLYGVLSFAIPRDLDIAYVRAIERGVRDHLADFDAAIVGGNVSGIEKTLVCDLTLVGACARGKAWRRTCRPGKDAIVVAGFLGDSRAGLDSLRRGGRASGALVRAYKKPIARLDVAKLLASDEALRAAIHGAIDVSDGLSTDVIHVCEASGAGCEIRADALPISGALEAFCKKTGADAVSMALHGGEDYALLLAVDAKSAEAVASRIERALGIPSRVVGRFTSGRGKYILARDGRRTVFEGRGWDHLASSRR
jgi:thiamine-monophosphate kinase